MHDTTKNYRTWTFLAVTTCLFSIVLFSVLELNSQQLQQGVSVALAPTNNAKPAPDADESSAWIVTVSSNGRLWFGITPVTPDALANKMIETPRIREQKLYIKADARAPYSAVVGVLKAAHVVGFETATLLTGQRASAEPNRLTPPMGLEVWIENGALTGEPIDVEIRSSQGSSAVKVNAQDVSWTNLQPTIKQLSENQAESIVRVSADGTAAFSDVARAIDASRSAAGKVVLVTPTI